MRGRFVTILVGAVALITFTLIAWSTTSSPEQPTLRTRQTPTTFYPVFDEPVVPASTLIEQTPRLDRPTATRGPQIQVVEPPEFDPVAYVNGLPYAWTFAPPALEALRVVSQTAFGLPPEWADSHSEFAERIMRGESAFCWNARRWTMANAGTPCAEANTGIYDDVGFGQITNVLRTPRSPLCAIDGICTIEQTIASPYESMRAFISVMLNHGKQPWCYRGSFHLRNGDCASWPAT